MASTTKALLKAAKEAIDQRKWDNAIEATDEVLQKDAKNYLA